MTEEKKCKYNNCNKKLKGRQEKFCCENHKKYYYRDKKKVNKINCIGNYVKVQDFNKFQEEVLQAFYAINIRLDDIDKKLKTFKNNQISENEPPFC